MRTMQDRCGASGSLFSLLGLALLIGVAIGAAVEAVARHRPRAAPWVLPVVMAVAVAALLPQALAKRSPASRVDDVLTAAGEIRRLKKPGDAVLFIPAARRDTRLVTPDAFTGLRDIALGSGRRPPCCAPTSDPSPTNRPGAAG